MKKLAIALLVAGGIYYYFNRKKTDENTPEKEQPQGLLVDVFREYNNQVISDIDGYWMLVKDGKLYTPKSFQTLQAWQAANPLKPGVVEVKQQVWVLNQDKAAGSF
jgi:hypothetical protein